jgi:hypothetical protein
MQTKQIEDTQIAWVYFTVQQFSEQHRAFTVGGLRSLIFNANSNGLAKSGGLVRLGCQTALKTFQ